MVVVVVDKGGRSRLRSIGSGLDRFAYEEIQRKPLKLPLMVRNTEPHHPMEHG